MKRLLSSHRAKLAVSVVAIGVLSGCASVSLEQNVNRVNTETTGFTDGQLSLAQSNQEREQRAQLAAQLLEKPLGQKEAVQLVSDAHKKAFEMREHAAKNAAKNADDIIAQATEQARIIRERAEGEITALEQTFSKRMKEGVMSAAVELNKKLLGQSNTARHDFMKAHLDDVVKK